MTDRTHPKVQIIKTYQLRELYSEDTPLLHESFFIMDRLLLTTLPHLHAHLVCVCVRRHENYRVIMCVCVRVRINR